MSTDRLPQIPAAKFVEKWQAHGPEYFENLGYSVNAVKARAAKLRKLGVPLKPWSTARTGGLDIEALKQIAEQALSTSAEPLDNTDQTDDGEDSDV